MIITKAIPMAFKVYDGPQPYSTRLLATNSKSTATWCLQRWHPRATIKQIYTSSETSTLPDYIHSSLCGCVHIESCARTVAVLGL